MTIIAYQYDAEKNKKFSKFGSASTTQALPMETTHKLWLLLIFITICTVWKFWSTPEADATINIYDFVEFPLRILQGFIKKLLSLSWIIIPLAVSSMFVGFCWTIIYLDSKVPGKEPPLPGPGLHMHLQYATTLYIAGLILFKIIYENWEQDPVLQ